MPQPPLLLVSLLLASSWAPLTAAQGLTYDPQERLGASSSFQSLASMYAKSKAWRAAFKQAPAAVFSYSNRGSLCGPSASADEVAQLLLATSPRAYDSRRPEQAGGFAAVDPVVYDQGTCNSCVSCGRGCGIGDCECAAEERHGLD